MTGLRELLRYTRATAIVGDILKIRAHDVGRGDMARVEMPDGEQSLAQTIQLEGDELSLRFAGQAAPVCGRPSTGSHTRSAGFGRRFERLRDFIQRTTRACSGSGARGSRRLLGAARHLNCGKREFDSVNAPNASLMVVARKLGGHGRRDGSSGAQPPSPSRP
jgi:hypothetical protein